MIGFSPIGGCCGGGDTPFPADFITLTFVNFSQLKFNYTIPAQWNSFLNDNGSVGCGFTNVLIDDANKVIKLAGNLDQVSTIYLNGILLSDVELTKLVNMHMLVLSTNQLDTFSFVGMGGLEWIDLGANNLTELDFSPITGSQNLQFLAFNSNQISGVFAPKLPVLSVLSLTNNLVEEIGFHNMQNIQRLNVYGNNLSSINLSELPLLTSFNIDANELITNLDLSANPILNLLTASFCDLTTLDISNNTQLKTLNLEHQKVGLQNLIGYELLFNPSGSTFQLRDNALSPALVGPFISYMNDNNYLPQQIWMHGGTSADISGNQTYVDAFDALKLQGCDIKCNPFIL